MKIEGIKNYLAEKIGHWYAYAKSDYGVEGRLLNVEANREALLITWEENSEKFLTTIGYFEEYTLQRLYDIWMEQGATGCLVEKVA